jgi:hypothetical protein
MVGLVTLAGKERGGEGRVNEIRAEERRMSVIASYMLWNSLSDVMGVQRTPE